MKLREHLAKSDKICFAHELNLNNNPAVLVDAFTFPLDYCAKVKLPAVLYVSAGGHSKGFNPQHLGSLPH